MQINDADAAAMATALRNEGFCWLPQPVSPDDADAARASIDSELARHGKLKDPLNGFCPTLLASAPILRLYNDSQAHAASSALLAGAAVRAVKQAQIALRFPGDGEGYVPTRLDSATDVMTDDEWSDVWFDSEAEHGTRMWHIDGMNRNCCGQFSLLIGVFLNAGAGCESGNLCVWPGSHHTVSTATACHFTHLSTYTSGSQHCCLHC